MENVTPKLRILIEASGTWRDFDINWHDSVIAALSPACRIRVRGKHNMPTQVAHFAINANDVSRARSFYENVFGWKFAAWGPPGFYMIETDAAPASVPLRGSLQKRREIVPGVAMHGFECTISVDNID